MRQIISGAVGGTAALLSFAAMGADCPSGPPDQWLVGKWHSSKTTVVIRRESNDLVWTYEREEGLATERWGEKTAAKAAGRVEKLEGCMAFLKGAYTAYYGRSSPSRPAVGWPMEYTVELSAPGFLIGQGIGYGREPFRLMWQKAE